ncbi:DUF5665 domain-containing protein [Alkalicoccus urumqiensis]|uniref:Uncharacterized protein n=1 Tax=Alkalicoccus urumqiensis TaxID=1548213 RepID=A0A2P6MIV1_ALKUR|nr:DUF5665 domain-containing protein [Alkalicoccus urumqiensis]PRO66219.1 hypothetical protein C6I21_05295 [Alkalicoccus urumqiensis]
MPLSKEQEKRKVPSKSRGDEKRAEENERFEVLLDKLEEITTNGRLKDMAYHFTNKKEVIKTNLIAGVARGVGLTVGTAIFLALLFFILNALVDTPMVGEYIGNLLNSIESYRDNG